jgi:hypothetical protein
MKRCQISVDGLPKITKSSAKKLCLAKAGQAS